ncbi:hypothetical protein ACMGDK_11445 [Chryseobacterium sp. DT-3]|uniref:hypothetical protein n=1 Tax=Chryseobacterium sp. DT-3 TaxID=3396164 RepID=UPI003F1A25C9
MLKTDKSYRRNLHTIEKEVIPISEIEKLNKSRSWEYGYNKKYDVVIISKDGTIGDVLNIDGLLIAIPSTPKKIRHSLLQNKDQKWTRYEVPKELAFFHKYFKDSENVEGAINQVHNDHCDFIKEDFNRIRNGEWFMNDGVPLYITGGYYFFLQHYKLTDNRYPDFRMTQRDYYIWIEACYADDRCYGSLLLKSRRSSFTTTGASEILRDAIRHRDSFYPLVSKTENDAKKIFTKHIVRPFLKFPKHLQPQRVGEAVPKSKLEFNSAQRKLTANNKMSDDGDGLDTTIEPMPTTLDAYDGTEVKKSLNDEIGKFKGQLDLNEFWDQAHKMTHEVGSDIVGKSLNGSTANPPNKGGKNYETFYNDSKVSTRDDTGQTKTGLYALFIPADYSLRGFFDEYGYVIYDTPSDPILNERGKLQDLGAKEYLDKKEIACGSNLKKLNARKRNNPRFDNDAFLDEDATSMFATEGLVNHKNFIKKHQYTDKYQSEVFRFDLSWKDGIEDSTVVMTRKKDGKFLCSWLPPVELRNNVKTIDGKKYPVNADLGAFGADPYDSSKVKYGNGSKMGFKGLTKDNHYKLHHTERNKMFLHYNARPATKDEAEEDIIKALVYFSMPILPEINKKSLVEKLKKRGYRKFVLNNPLKKKIDLTPDEKEFGGIVSTFNGKSGNIKAQQDALEAWIIENIPEDVDEDNLKVPFIDVLEDAEIYEEEDRQKRDGTVAWMYAVLATNEKVQPKENPTTANTTINFKEIFSLT